MAMETEQVFFLVCDYCGERLTNEDHGGYLVETTEQAISETAESYDWRCDDYGKWECFGCFEEREPTVPSDRVTYYAIGKYDINATDAQKILACQDAMMNAALEMIRLGASLEDVMTATEDAFDAAEIEVQERGDRG